MGWFRPSTVIPSSFASIPPSISRRLNSRPSALLKPSRAHPFLIRSIHSVNHPFNRQTFWQFCQIPVHRNFSTFIKADPIPIERIRNVAIIAHVDHGKTTLVDSILNYVGLSVASSRLLDQGDLEKEKGITILAKATRVEYKGHFLNVSHSGNSMVV